MLLRHGIALTNRCDTTIGEVFLMSGDIMLLQIVNIVLCTVMLSVTLKTDTAMMVVVMRNRKFCTPGT